MYKFFQVGGMRAQRILLNLLIDYWNPDVEEFMLVGKSLTMMVEDISFITSLSRRGEVPNFQSQGRVWSINDFINEYCIIDTLVQIMGSNSLHMALQAQMNCGVECLCPTMYDWSTTMLNNMKVQLTDCNLRKAKNFFFGSVMCTFFFERVPMMSPRTQI